MSHTLIALCWYHVLFFIHLYLRRSLGLPEALRLASLSRNITSPLAMAICAMLAADASFAIAIVVMTGVIGANFGPTALDALG